LKNEAERRITFALEAVFGLGYRRTIGEKRMKPDLENMSRDELLQLKADIDRALESLETRRKAEALKAAEDAARKYGFSLQELKEVGGKRTKGVPRYRNPKNPSQTWTGKGRKPKWVLEALDEGIPMEKMEI
jgi:DNA-binding protein H-NS